MKRAPMQPNHVKQGRIMSAFADPPPRTKPRATQMKEVACPECSAGVGDVCLTSKGTVLASSHTSRRRMAGRLDNERREAAGTLVAPAYPPRAPGPREDPNGTHCPYCGLTIRMAVTATGFKVLDTHTSKGTSPSHRVTKCPGSRVRPKDLRPPSEGC